MFQKLIEVYLLLSRSKKSYFDKNGYEKHEVKFSLDEKKELIEVKENDHNPRNHVLSYYINDNFDPNRKTILYFHPRKFGKYDINGFRGDHNTVIFDFLGYAENYNKNILTQIGKYNIQHLLQESEIILSDLEKKLEQKYVNHQYKRDNDLIFCGRSMGTIIATKLDAKLENEGHRCAHLINFVTPININVAVKSGFLRMFQLPFCSIKNLNNDLRYGFKKINAGKEYESSPAKEQFCYSILILLLISLLISMYAGYGFLIYHTVAKSANKGKIAITSILFILIVILPAFATFIFFCDSKNAGITKEDIDQLKETPVTLFAIENDSFCNMNYLKNYFNPDQRNISIYKILSSSNLIDAEKNLQPDQQFIEIKSQEENITKLIINNSQNLDDEKRTRNERYNELLRVPVRPHCCIGVQNAAFEQVFESKKTRN